MWASSGVWDTPGIINPVTTSLVPPARSGHTLTPDYTGTALYMFGGQLSTGGTIVNDLYVVSRTGFAKPNPATEMNLLSQGRATAMINVDANFRGLASRAVDGNINTDMKPVSGSLLATDNLCTCTNLAGTTDPWWTVDLGSTQTIDLLRIYARTDAGTDRITGFEVYVNNVATFSKLNAAFASNLQCSNPYSTIKGKVDLDVSGTSCGSGEFLSQTVAGCGGGGGW